MVKAHSNVAGFLFEAEGLPVSLPQHLERVGAALVATSVRDGLYAEPAATLAALLDEVERAGVQVAAVHRFGAGQSWWRSDRPARPANSRLRNPSSACWLPTAA